MAKIIRLDSSQKPSVPQHPVAPCDHRDVVAYTAYRTVRCSVCGALLDPFDVLVDMITGHIPPDGGGDEEKRFGKEADRRQKGTSPKEHSD